MENVPKKAQADVGPEPRGGSTEAEQGRGVEQSSKKTQVESVQELCTTITEALRNAPNLPSACREMLSDLVACTLGIPWGQRHDYQVAGIEILQDAMSSIEADMMGRLQEAEATIARGDADRADIEGAQNSAEAQLRARREEVTEKSKAVVKAQSGITHAKRKIADAGVALDFVKSQVAALAKDKAVYDDALSGPYEGLRTGAADAAKLVEALLPLCRTMGLDQSMLVALPKVAKKPPDARGAFDKVVVDQLGRELSTRSVTLESKMGEWDVAAAEREVEMGKAALLAAEEDTKNAEEAVKVAQAAVVKSEAVLREARNAAREFPAKLLRVKITRDITQRCINDFKNGPVQAFSTLTSQPPLAEAVGAASVQGVPTPCRPAAAMPIPVE
eukprot:CAMPEP_0117536320 /NCGR_PEP_ID=MMETSP0784-20121206/41392_1 /TAXON_ID=39447 /ORGANISM="" /LENGTH=388 /DNA_ID=CAMNT_0005332879 /DNA_START=81 /DNA_END=1247 /DNA_ORIENTATION=-